MDRFENVKIGEAPFPGVNVELVTSLRALPVVKLSLTGGKIYPREFKIPVSGTVYYKDGSSEEVTTHMTVLPNNNIQKPREPNVPPWTPSYEDNSSGSSDEGDALQKPFFGHLYPWRHWRDLV